MNINHHYKTLKISDQATDEQISASYKRLAMLYHPDKNINNTEWATEAMKNLNIAYNAIMSYRFSNRPAPEIYKAENKKRETTHERPTEQNKPEQASKKTHDGIDKEILINKFVKIRENAKDSLYRYFQYGLFSIPRRENTFNRGVYNEIVNSLRRSYHSINNLSKKTDDTELLLHFNVFNRMLFNFYKASECINIIDSYNNKFEVDAYRMYVRGDEKLHLAHKEIFFDRHNRGHFKGGQVIPLLNQSTMYFSHVISDYSLSTWVVEARIKTEYIQSVKDYLNLFFTND